MSDLWDDEGVAVSRPQRIVTSPGWTIDPEMAPVDKNAPRRRAYEVIQPNKRAAVAVPHPGQSVNPTFGDHQAALQKAVASLEKKQLADARFQRWLSMKGDGSYKGNLMGDRNWEDDDGAAAEGGAKPSTSSKRTVGRKSSRSAAAADDDSADNDDEAKSGSDASDSDSDSATPRVGGKKTNASGKKKYKPRMNKTERAKEMRRQRVHRRHPDRITKDDIALLDDVQKEHQKREKRLEKLRAAREERKEAGQAVKSFGRYHHQPLVLDVAPSEEIVGSLRHVKASGRLHPALDRVKSLEERNLIPARMRHVFHQRKELMPTGEIKMRKEDMGMLPMV